MSHPAVPDIALRYSGEILFLQGAEILCVVADGSYCRLQFTDRRRYTLSRKLGEIEAALPDYFLRVHHSHIVNLLHVVKYLKGSAVLVLVDGEELPVSPRYRRKLLDRFCLL